MGLRINQNIAAMNAYRNLTVTEGQLNKSLERLSSGYRINRAADDAAGLVISENLRSQVGGLKVAVQNAQDGISVVQTAEGALTEVHSILQRMRDLSVQSSNGGGTDATSRAAAQSEITQLNSELDRISATTRYGGNKLLDGTFTGQVFQVGANNTANDRVSVSINATDSTTLGVNAVDVSTVAGAQSAIDSIDTAISTVSTERANLGAVQNRFEHTIANLNVAAENLSASESRVRDTDMAQEMVSFTRAQILQQAGTAMLAQANQVPQTVLQLLRG
jgi:flagellin